MYGRRHIHRVAALLTAVAALAFLAGSVQAANSRPAGMTKAAYRALVLRSEALDEKYHLGIWANKPASMSARAYRALVLRSKALDRKYGLGGSTTETASAAPAVVAGSGFPWRDLGIGAATMLAIMLVGMGVFFGSRRGRGSLRARRSS
jgi:hypothetical protein